MSNGGQSSAYVQHYKRGPFSQRIDPWAEAARYFHQIHSGIVDHLQQQLQDRLIAMGYQAGKETSLQIFEYRKPDLFIEQEQLKPLQKWDYDAAVAAYSIEPGEAVLIEEIELNALHIWDFDSGGLVTVIEVISPSNKDISESIIRYQQHRQRLFLGRGVNVVEIDLTRSYKRLLEHPLTHNYPYHTAIYLPGDLPRVIVHGLEQPLKSFALPLRAEVIPVELHQAYEHAYKQGAIAGQILKQTRYAESSLPFPTLLTDDARKQALEAVAAWTAELDRLRI